MLIVLLTMDWRPTYVILKIVLYFYLGQFLIPCCTFHVIYILYVLRVTSLDLPTFMYIVPN